MLGTGVKDTVAMKTNTDKFTYRVTWSEEDGELK